MRVNQFNGMSKTPVNLNMTTDMIDYANKEKSVSNFFSATRSVLGARHASTSLFARCILLLRFGMARRVQLNQILLLFFLTFPRAALLSALEFESKTGLISLFSFCRIPTRCEPIGENCKKVKMNKNKCIDNCVIGAICNSTHALSPAQPSL